MSRFFVCQGPACKEEHSYCHTCYKEVCEKGEADVHRSIGHEVQPAASAQPRRTGPRQAKKVYDLGQ